jgi:hypothetical protein
MTTFWCIILLYVLPVVIALPCLFFTFSDNRGGFNTTVKSAFQNATLGDYVMSFLGGFLPVINGVIAVGCIIAVVVVMFQSSIFATLWKWQPFKNKE